MARSLLQRLEKSIGFLAIPNITLYIVFLQSLAYVLGMVRPNLFERMLFIPELVAAGEWWRVISFVLIPPATNPIFLLFALYLFWLMGTALEAHWGTFRYNLYLLIAYVATIAAGLVVYYAGGAVADEVGTNSYIGGSVFLAFAWLYPNFTIMLFFILPVQIKWLALLTWIFFGFRLLTGSWLDQVLVLAAVLNFLLFFGKELILAARSGKRRMERQMERNRAAEEPFHVCTVCGVTEKTNPKMEFRYCPECVGTPCYCIDHINNHTHRTQASVR